MDYRIQMNNTEKSYLFQLAYSTDESRKSKFAKNFGSSPKSGIDLLLSIVGREALRENRPNLQELDRIIKNLLEQDSIGEDSTHRQDTSNNSREEENARALSLPSPILRMLLHEGYLKNDEKWLTSRGFSRIGNMILDDVMRALKLGEAGGHGTKTLGTGSVLLDTTRKYEDGNDIRLVNIPLSLLNSVLRVQKEFGRIEIPVQMKTEDLEEYETLHDVRASVVYCIDLSSTMKYSRMFGDLSRIEASKEGSVEPGDA